VLLHVTDAQYIADYRLRLKFNNGAQGVVDLESELYGEVFEPLRDKKTFRQFTLTSRTLEWPNGADFAPEFLFDVATILVEPDQQASIFYPLSSQAIHLRRVAALHEPSDTSGYGPTESEES
jgi:hypothetical protein